MIDERLPKLSKSLEQARIKLMLDEPYLASAIARFPLIDAKAEGHTWCDTMAVDGFYIYVNPDFCEGLTGDELKFVLAHEVMHCVLGHSDRRGGRDRKLWNIATDYSINLKLTEFGFKMPKVGLINNKYEGLTSEEIYEELFKEGMGRLELVSIAGSKILGSSEAVTESQGLSKSESGVKPEGSTSQGSISQRGKTKRSPSQIIQDKAGWDLHLDESDIRGREQRLREFPSPQERKRLRITILNDLKKNLRGSVAGRVESELRIARGEQIPWNILLSKFFTGLRRDNYRLLPPNKKHIWRKIYLPSMGVPGPSHIVVAIDTSGSMSDRVLSRVLGEIDNLRSSSQCRLTLIQCDAEIQSIQEFDEYESISFERYQILGRGGTSFSPVFNWVRKKQEEGSIYFDTLIFLTDGFGDFPIYEPNCPVLWVITKGGLEKVPFGERIELD